MIILFKHYFHFRSSVGPEFARKRGLIFLILSLLFILIGVGVTVGLNDNL